MPEPQDLLGSGSNVPPGGIRVHGLSQGHRGAQHREDGIHLPQGRIGLDAACQRKDRHAVDPGQSGHSSRSLAHGGLTIELSLTGEAEVAAREKSCQAGLLQDDGSTGAQFCPQKGGKAKAQPTGSAAARKIRVTAGEGGSGLFGKPPEGGIQPGITFGPAPFWGP